MNVYDFDKTIYPGDSTVDFYLYCVCKQPSLLRFFPAQAMGVLKYKLGRCDKTAMKQAFFCFLKGVDAPAMAQTFWQSHRRLASWYQPTPEDVIISASPAFLLKPFCTQLGIAQVIASEVDPATGAFTTPNCRGAEKVRRFRSLFPDQTVHAFYSDSLSDSPMARIAQKAFLIRRSQIEPWPDFPAKDDV